jgi:hypothetical protein
MFSTKNNRFFALCLLGQMASMLFASVEEIDTFDKILPEIDAKTLVLLDLDETLIETPMMLGGKAWRKYVKKLIEKVRSEKEAEEIHDKLTYFLAKRIAYIPVEKSTPDHIKTLQLKGTRIFGFTARGKYHWYDLEAKDGQELTLLHLRQAGFDFSISQGLPHFEEHWSYVSGVFFAYPLESKGELALDLFDNGACRPNKILFVDDKLAHVQDVDKVLGNLHIPAKCYFYRHFDLHRTFDPMVSHIQLEKLLFENLLLSDAEAVVLKTSYGSIDPDSFFLQLVNMFLEGGWF